MAIDIAAPMQKSTKAGAPYLMGACLVKMPKVSVIAGHEMFFVNLRFDQSESVKRFSSRRVVFRLS